MHHITRIIKQQFIGILAFAGLVATIASAATGGPVLLGKANSAGAPTAVQNTGNGAVLDLKAKAGQPPLKVNSNKLVGKLNADLLDGKNSSAFAAAGSSYSKAESDAKYLDGTEAYTKALADAAFLSPAEAYTKSQVDAGFLSQADGDARYGRILFASSYSGNTPAVTNETSAALTQTVAAPGKGDIQVMLWLDPGANVKCGAQPEVAAVVRGGVDNSQGSGSGTVAVVHAAAAGNIEVKALIRNYQDATSVSCTGHVTVAFFGE